MLTEDSTKAKPSQDSPVSQDEVEKLLAQMAGGDSQEDDPASVGAIANNRLERHSFPRLSFFSPSELRKLRVRHEEFIHSLSARLAAFLRLEITLQMSKLETSSFQKFTEGLSNLTHITFVRFEPLAGICLLELPLRLALTLVDRELGGPGQYTDEPRELSHVETRLLSHVLDVIVGEWCNSWSDMLDIRPVLLGQESSGRYVQTSPPQHTMLVVGIELRIGELAEQVQLAFPYQTLEAVLLKLNAGPGTGQGTIADAPKPPPVWKPGIADLKILVQAKLLGLKLTAGQIAALQPGVTLPLPDGIFNQVRLCLQNQPRFMGSFGASGDQPACRIDQILPRNSTPKPPVAGSR